MLISATPQALFPSPVDDLWMEIGFGAGEHLVAKAARYPNIGFIGCEPYVNGVATLLTKINDQALTNIRIYDDDVRQLMPVMPTACLGRLYVLFSDPWPKVRHHGRRITVEANLTASLVCCVPGPSSGSPPIRPSLPPGRWSACSAIGGSRGWRAAPTIGVWLRRVGSKRDTNKRPRPGV